MSSKFLAFTDYTSLRSTDTPNSIAKFVDESIGGNPASYCVYSSMVESVGLALGDREVPITAVCGAFPNSQTFLEVKILDVAMAIENGADEIDVVINVGAVLEGDTELAMSEIRAISEEIDGDALLKVILETGTLESEQLIFETAMAAMAAGADFIKTSTGFSEVGATPEAVRAICRAIKSYYELEQKYIGIKISGGIRTDEQAEEYIAIIKEELPAEWMTPALLRFGRSTL